MSDKKIICPACGAELPEISRFCNMCGTKVYDEEKELIAKKKAGEIPLAEKTISTPCGVKTIRVYCGDITSYKGEIGLLTISAGAASYEPVQGTVIAALEYSKGIVIRHMADNACLKISGQTDCWISDEIDVDDTNSNIHRIGCVQRSPYAIRRQNGDTDEDSILKSLKAYYKLVDFLADTGKKIGTIVMPLLGSGSMGMNNDLIAYPLVNEAVEALKRNPAVKEIVFIERSFSKASQLADCLEQSYQLMKCESADSVGKSNPDTIPYVFISYSTSGDYEVAERMYFLLKEKGIDCWFAPKNIRHGDYATKIVEGIEKCTHFICIVSKNSLNSAHVLNEVDLAFQHIRDGIEILPFRMDDDELNPSFKYYLSRMQWNYGNPPPLEDRIKEFINEVFDE